ncbi:MAG TPA: BcsR/BcsP family cellulose biosynthesis protein [Burkholderiaceae bacterium]|nr:BcsR/BcsP family cellulose biosynthesis protein [Burkholderiaceae bacterium]
MARQFSRQEAFPEDDATRLVSHLGRFVRGFRYREIVQEDAASQAACRWPLLMEIVGIEDTDPQPEK